MHKITFLATECLDCWNGLCRQAGGLDIPNCALSDNDCIDYGGVDRIGPMLAQPANYLLCCEAAGGYVNTTIQNLTQLTLCSKKGDFMHAHSTMSRIVLPSLDRPAVTCSSITHR